MANKSSKYKDKLNGVFDFKTEIFYAGGFIRLNFNGIFF